MNTERQAKLKNALDQIVHTLITQYQPEKIILFGSLVNDTVHEWSDIDLVIIKDTPLPFLQRSIEVGLMCHVWVGVDYFVYTPTEFAQLISEKNFFILGEVLTKGKVLYERKLVSALAG